MLPFGVTIPGTIKQRSEIPEGLMNYHVYNDLTDVKITMFKRSTLEELEEVKAVWIQQ
jgi:hypothetical protein